jgi:hypothetical protein
MQQEKSRFFPRVGHAWRSVCAPARRRSPGLQKQLCLVVEEPEGMRKMFRVTGIAHPLEERWIPPDRFKVEGAGAGIVYHPDFYYIRWTQLSNVFPRPILAIDERERGIGRIFRSARRVLLGHQAAGRSDEGYWFARKLAPRTSVANACTRIVLVRCSTETTLKAPRK